MWSGCEGVSVQQVALWWVCVGIVCAECGTVWSGCGGVSVQQVALWWVCVCVGGSLCVCEQRELNDCCLRNHSFVLWKFIRIFVIYDVN